MQVKRTIGSTSPVGIEKRYQENSLQIKSTGIPRPRAHLRCKEVPQTISRSFSRYNT